jgi:hypothetical protein
MIARWYISMQKIGLVLKAIEWKNLGIFCCYFGILWPFGIFCGHLLYIFLFWYQDTKKKSGNPAT